MFMSIRQRLRDLRANPLARLTWGVEPRNLLRRRRALVSLLWPSLLWLALAAGLGFFNVRGILEVYFAISSAAGFLVACIALLQTGIGSRQAHRLRENWDDYTLAGLTPEQIVLGLGGPRLAGLYLLALLLFLPGVGMATKEGWGDSDLIYILIIFYVTPIYLLLLAPFELALWALVKSSWLRLVYLALASLLTSPLYFFIAALVLSQIFGGFIMPNIDEVYAFVAELISWPLRLIFVILFWRWGMRRLEAQPPHAPAGEEPLTVSANPRLDQE